MDIKQQTKNVAAQGRFGDSMLLHVNPAEVKGLASQVPLTVNPETGQPEAFLPFLAPIVGGMLGSSLLALLQIEQNQFGNQQSLYTFWDKLSQSLSSCAHRELDTSSH